MAQKLVVVQNNTAGTFRADEVASLVWTATANRSIRNPRDKYYVEHRVACSAAGNKCCGIFWWSLIVRGTRSQSWNCHHRRLKLYVSLLIGPTNALEFTNLISLHSNQPHVPSSRGQNKNKIAINELIRHSDNPDTLIVIVCLFSPLCRWAAETCRWLIFNKTTFKGWSVFVGLFKIYIYIYMCVCVRVCVCVWV